MIETIIVMALGAFVFFASVCRLAPMQLGRHRTVWICIYLCFAGYAFGEALSAGWALANNHSVDLLSALGLAGAAMMLWASRHTWQAGPPKHMWVSATETS